AREKTRLCEEALARLPQSDELPVAPATGPSPASEPTPAPAPAPDIASDKPVFPTDWSIAQFGAACDCYQGGARDESALRACAAAQQGARAQRASLQTTYEAKVKECATKAGEEAAECQSAVSSWLEDQVYQAVGESAAKMRRARLELGG